MLISGQKSRILQLFNRLSMLKLLIFDMLKIFKVRYLIGNTWAQLRCILHGIFDHQILNIGIINVFVDIRGHYHAFGMWRVLLLILFEFIGRGVDGVGFYLDILVESRLFKGCH